MDAFPRFLSVSTEELEISLRGHVAAPWSDFLLNPRRLRGSDFLMRWSPRCLERETSHSGETGRYVAVPYGPSGTAPDNDVRAFELYFERLDKAGLGTIKRPDLLIFSADDSSLVEKTIAELGGAEELPFTSESDRRMRLLISKAVIAVECENSLWVAKQMPAFGSTLSPQRRLGGKLGLKKTAVLPTVIIKEEDRKPLTGWQDSNGLPIHI